MLRNLAIWTALPVATLWVWRQERMIRRRGKRLSPNQLADARKLGIAHPDRIRLRIADEVPAGLHPLLKRVGSRLGLVSPGTIGMSLRYGVMLRADCRDDRRILAHELAHTLQYERLGGIFPFLRAYLGQCFTVGYDQAPLEHEAEELAQRVCG